MSASEMMSTAILFLGVVLGPIISLMTIVGYGLSSAIAWIKEQKEQKHLRSLPCTHCHYFLNDEFLQCAVNPAQALTDESHHCRDFSQSAHQATGGNVGGKTVKATKTV